MGKKYVDVKKELEQKAKMNQEEKRKKYLEQFDLFEKVYGEQSKEFPFVEEGDLFTKKFYKKVYEDVTDEELQVLIDLSVHAPDESFERSPWYFFYMFMGVVVILLGLTEGLPGLVLSIPGGLIFFSIAHIFYQLGLINNKVDKLKK